MEVAYKKKPPLTYEHYLLTSEDKRYELIGGELYMIPSPSFKHQQVVNKINVSLYEYVEKNELGVVVVAPMDVKFSGIDVLQPDILFISSDRRQIIKEAFIDGPPDLIVEVVSPAMARRDRTMKKDIYYREGVKEMWIVDPEEKAIDVFERGDAGFEKVVTVQCGETMQSNLFKKFNPTVKNFFQ